MSLITISQDYSCGGNEIAKKVADSLQVDLFDDNRLRDEAVKLGVSAGNLKGLEEKTPGFFDRLLGYKPDIYLDVLQSVVYRIARKGSGVIIGHGSQVLLKDFDCAFHIRIFASKEKRADNLVTTNGIDRQAALKIVNGKDDEYAHFFQYAFKKSYNDISQYDLVLNTGKISVDTAAQQIIALAKSDDILACGLNAMENMGFKALEHKIHADLLEKGLTARDIKITVTANGTAQLRGFVFSEDAKFAIEAAVYNVEGVDNIDTNIAVIPYSA